MSAGDVRASYLQRIPGSARLPRMWLPLYASAVSSLRVRDADVILSSSSAWMKGLRPDGALHICYCHSLMKWAWQVDRYFTGSYGSLLRLGLTPLLGAMRRWDLRTSAEDRLHVIVANSETTRSRIRTYWGREARVLHPGIDLTRFDREPRREGFFLVVSRLVPYKRIDVAVEACSRLGLPLQVVGGGPDLERLRQIAGPTVIFRGRCSDQEVVDLMSGCEALLFPGEEDFGMTPVEVMASGKPVVALGRGGALETVLEGETGEFYAEPTADSLASVLEGFDGGAYAPSRCRARARDFSLENFRRSLRAIVQEEWSARSG